MRKVRSVREREIQRERERKREIDGSDVIIVALKLAMSLHFPMPKIRTIAVSSHFPLPKYRTFRFSLHTSCLSIVALKFTLSVAKKFALLVPILSNVASRATNDRKPKTNDQILPSPIVLAIEKMNQINTKNYLEIEKEIVREVARGDKPYTRKSTDRKAQICKAFVQLCGLICAL